MSMIFNTKALLRNSWVLIIVGILSIISLGTFMYRKQNDYVAIFVISGAIASIFSRNMVVVLTMAMGCAWMVQWSRKMSGFREGMEDASGGDASGGEDATILVSNEPSADTTPSTTDTKVIDPKTTMLEPDTPPTAVERKLDDLQIKLDTIQSELFELKNRS